MFKHKFMHKKLSSSWKIAGVLSLAAASLAPAAHAGYDENVGRDSDTSMSTNSSVMTKSSVSSRSTTTVQTVSVSTTQLTTMMLGGRTRYVDPQMKAVLMSLMELHPKPIETLTPTEARKQPGPPDAVKRTLKKEGRSTAPEAVGAVINTTVPGPAGRIPVRVYKPLGVDSNNLPVLVYFHGGGFVIASVQAYDSSCRALANAAKCMVVSVGYRYAPEHRLPAAHEDCYAATQWVMNHADQWGGDKSRVAVGGESAGGNLATNMCMMARDRGGKMPIYQMLVYPYVDTSFGSINAPSARENAKVIPLNRAMLTWFSRYALPSARFGRTHYASPLFGNVRGLPAATVVQAEIDPLRSQGTAYIAKLRAAGIPVRARLYRGVTHEFFGMGAVIDQSKDAVNFAAQGLKDAFKR